ncbi:MAG: L-histidine N(alpha)-methyltransferase [Pseudomonadota bacterium]
MPANTAEKRDHQISNTASDFADALFDGLTKGEKSIPCRFLYDAKGSDLFEQITRQPEYYPTRTEAAILKTCAPHIVARSNPNTVLVEFGSGSSLKTEILLSAFNHLAAYIPLDISQAALDDAVGRLNARFPKLSITPITADFSAPIDLPEEFSDHEHLGFFPGSTIGNMAEADAIALLGSMRETLGKNGRLVIGTDLVKPLDVLLPAYNDEAGVTAAFNLNVLRHANRVIGTDFDLSKFRHESIWNADKSRIEMHLISLTDQTIRGLSKPITISKGEHLHTENSHKYTVERFHHIAETAGWTPTEVWTDPSNLFAVHDLRAS